jgi:hypothetical protein
MKRRHFKRYIKVGWGLVVILLLVGIFVVPGTPADASQSVVHSRKDAVGLNAKVYITQATLKPLFQEHINQQVPGAVNAAINGIIGNLPGTSWAGQMAQSLLQPSAILTQLTPQQDGLHAVIRLSLYLNDPKPTDVHMLVKFSVLDASTVQISGQPIDGSATLVNGPLATIKVPIGQLNTIDTTPNCGDANLMIGLQVPADLTQTASTQDNQNNAQTNTQTLPLSYTQSSTQITPSSTKISMLDTIDNASSTKSSTFSTMVNLSQHSTRDGATDSYIEIPADSLTTLGNNVGTIQISKSLSAQNIQISVQDSNIVATSDIMGSFLGAPVKLATATTTIQPAAQDGKLVLNVLQTKITVAIVTFSQNSYNQQIQQLLNSKLSAALDGKFNVTSASLGNNSPISCAASDSLILTGTANLQ